MMVDIIAKTIVTGDPTLNAEVSWDICCHLCGIFVLDRFRL
jgi:hypothetical protein